MSDTREATPPFSVAVMRACPMHLGHQAIIEKMLAAAGYERTLLLLGSTNHPISFRYMFTYPERYELVRKRYPELRIAGAPDFPGDDDAWLFNIDTTLQLLGVSLREVTFFGGCREDVLWFEERNLATSITNRFSGEESPPISATEVRDALIERRSLKGLVDPLLIPAVEELFAQAMTRLKTF